MDGISTIEVSNNRVFIDGKETVDPILIGYALLDFAEATDSENFKLVIDQNDVIVQK